MFEVTGFRNVDENDFWQLTIISNEEL